MLARKQLKRVTIQGFGKIIFAHTSPRTRQQWRLYKAVLKYRPVKASPLTLPTPFIGVQKIFCKLLQRFFPSGYGAKLVPTLACIHLYICERLNLQRSVGTIGMKKNMTGCEWAILQIFTAARGGGLAQNPVSATPSSPLSMDRWGGSRLGCRYSANCIYLRMQFQTYSCAETGMDTASGEGGRGGGGGPTNTSIQHTRELGKNVNLVFIWQKSTKELNHVVRKFSIFLIK